MNVVLRLTEAAVEFLWGGVGWGGGVCKLFPYTRFRCCNVGTFCVLSIVACN